MTTRTHRTTSTALTVTIALALAGALAAALALLAPGISSAGPAGNQGGLASLAGAWRMTSLEVGGPAYQRVPYSGQVVFTRAGTMSVQASNPDEDAPDTAYTVNGYEAFYGTVDVDRGASTFTVRVESALAPALVGQALTREFVVSRSTLVLTPADPAEGWRVTYERM